jgi:hypothetical protein
LDGFETAGQQIVFHGLDRLQLPGFADELVEDEYFHGAFRGQFLPQSFAKLVVLFLLVGWKAQFLSRETVGDSVSGGSGFAFDGLRAGRVLRIGGVGRRFEW